MNAIANIEVRADGRGWAPNIQRLRADYEAARHAGELDPWSITEAECWLDLIEAELSAKSTQADPDLCARLVGWRQEIASLLVRMRALRAASDNRLTSFSSASVSQRTGGSRGPERPGHLAMLRPMSPQHGHPSQPYDLEEAS
jgi:hypothetical protein